MNLECVDIYCGLAWGDEAKGKIVSHLSQDKSYDMVCRWAGGNNAGHTVYVNGKKYHTHLIPSGVFYGIKSIIGPDCVINVDDFLEEICYLESHGFDTTLIKVSPKAHLVLPKHKLAESNPHLKEQGTTGKGIAPCYADKYLRKGMLAIESHRLTPYLWDEKIYGKVLCEGAQGFWLDINQGNYPYVTSSNTLPYGACSLGFPMSAVRYIFGACKIYDTRSGTDPDFPEELLLESNFKKIGELGEEYGTTTGRKRKVNYLNLDKLEQAVYLSGTTHLIISKLDILLELGVYKLFYGGEIHAFSHMTEMQKYIQKVLLDKKENNLLKIYYSSSPKTVEGLN